MGDLDWLGEARKGAITNYSISTMIESFAMDLTTHILNEINLICKSWGNFSSFASFRILCVCALFFSSLFLKMLVLLCFECIIHSNDIKQNIKKSTSACNRFSC